MMLTVKLRKIRLTGPQDIAIVLCTEPGLSRTNLGDLPVT